MALEIRPAMALGIRYASADHDQAFAMVRFKDTQEGTANTD